MFFKGNVPVNNKTIKERNGIRTKMASPADVGLASLPCKTSLKHLPLILHELSYSLVQQM